MRLRSFKLQNYRCFRNFSIKLDTRLTVLVGVNGAGKTTVLDGLALFLETIMNSMSQGQISVRAPLAIDAAICHKSTATPKKRSQVSYQISLTDLNDKRTGKSFRWEPINMRFDYHEIDSAKMYAPQNQQMFADIQKVINHIGSKRNQDGLPVFVYYKSKRFLPEDTTAQEEQAFKRHDSDVFSNAFLPLIDYASSVQWFSSMDALEARQAVNSRDLDYTMPELDALREAISLNLNDYERPRMDRSQEHPSAMELVIKKKGTEDDYTIKQLSDGYRTMLALVMDLARRMAVANSKTFKPLNRSVLESPAIVLIDEVELHLHAGWQQTVLPSLLNTFKNTQFIVTTHSPHVLTSIEPRQIRILKDGHLEPVITTTYGAESSRVLEEVLGVKPRPGEKMNDAIKELKEYLKLIDEGEWESKVAHEKRRKLNEWLEGDPVLDRADMLISRQERLRARKSEESDA
ncbi:hypothetical protein C4J81_03060 [Deltaproteobacteria bacterium Smac51]|nr:hypothetical protein C4J81_03060 [Deltaproteobacteria bacterium Smac51]